MSLASLTDFLSTNPQLGLVMIVGLGFIEACRASDLLCFWRYSVWRRSFLFVENLYSIVQIVPCAYWGCSLISSGTGWVGDLVQVSRVRDDAPSCQSIGSRREVHSEVRPIRCGRRAVSHDDSKCCATFVGYGRAQLASLLALGCNRSVCLGLGFVLLLGGVGQLFG